MNGASRESISPEAAHRPEDLNAVLGRFQNWAESSLTASPEKKTRPASATKPITDRIPGMGKHRSEAKQVSYEEALRASGYRRPERPIIPEALPASLPEVLKAEEPAVIATGAEEQLQPSKPLNKATPAPSISTETARGRKESAGHRGLAEPHHAAPVGTSPGLRSSRRAVSAELSQPKTRPKSRLKAKPQAKSQTKSGAKISPPLSANPHTNPVVTCEKTKPTPASSLAPPSPRRHLWSQPAFRDVLEGTVTLTASAPTSLPSSSAALERGKSASLTLRVSDAEHARILACAAQANLTVSAYLRQCALGVDELRSQVEITLAKLREQTAQPAPPPQSLAAIPKIIGQFALGCLNRLKKHGPSLALRC